MKEFAFIVKTDRSKFGKLRMVRFGGRTAQDAAAKVLKNMPLAEIVDVFEFKADKNAPKMDPNDESWKDQPIDPRNFDMTTFRDLEAEVAQHRMLKGYEQRQEELRKSKFKKYQNRADQAADALSMQQKEAFKDEVIKHALTGELSQGDWNKLLSAIPTTADRKDLKFWLEQSARENWPKNKNLPKVLPNGEPNRMKLAEYNKYCLDQELDMIAVMFGEKPKGKWSKNFNSGIKTFREIADLWGKSHVYVQKVNKQALMKICKRIGEMAHYPYKIKDLKQALEVLMSIDKKGDDKFDFER